LDAEEMDRIETLPREAVKAEDVPEENTVPVPLEGLGLERDGTGAGLS
jgi:hypothetical protein